MMKLSQAIKLGRMVIRPRPYRPYSKGGDDFGCVIRMAIAAIGRDCADPEQAYHEFTQAWPWTGHANTVAQLENCPSCGRMMRGRTMYTCLYHIFDEHVMDAKSTVALDDLIGLVRAIEPPEENTDAESDRNIVIPVQVEFTPVK